MKKILIFATLFWINFSYGEEFSPLKYEYNSPEFSCAINDFEFEHDLDYFEGYMGCMRSGTEEADFINERIKIRKDPIEFKRVQLIVAQNFIKKVLLEYPPYVLKSNEQIRKKLACYLSMLDNVPKELDQNRIYIVSNISLNDFKVLNILPESFFTKITHGTSFYGTSEEEIWAKYKEYELKLKGMDSKKYNYLGNKLLQDYINIKRNSKNRIKIRDENVFLDFIIKNIDEPSREEMLVVAEEGRFFPLLEDIIFVKNMFSRGENEREIQLIDIIKKAFESNDVSIENKCSAIKHFLDILNKSVIARGNNQKSFVTYLREKNLKCSFNYSDVLNETDPFNNAFYKKWCYQKNAENCLFALRNESGNIYQECNRNSDCIKSTIGNCGIFYSNKNVSSDLKNLFINWCSAKNGIVNYFLNKDDEPVCFATKCIAKGSR